MSDKQSKIKELNSIIQALNEKFDTLKEALEICDVTRYEKQKELNELIKLSS